MQFSNSFISPNFKNDNFIPKAEQQKQALKEVIKLLRNIRLCSKIAFFIYWFLPIAIIVILCSTNSNFGISEFVTISICVLNIISCIALSIFSTFILNKDFTSLDNLKLLKIFYITFFICTIFSWIILSMILALIHTVYCCELSKNIKILFPKKEKNVKKQKVSINTYNNLINRTGRRFFVKYYYQLKNWATCDLIEIIEENISQKDKLERIINGKKIFSLKLNFYFLKEIICNSSDKIDNNTIAMAKQIYQEEKVARNMII